MAVDIAATQYVNVITSKLLFLHTPLTSLVFFLQCFQLKSYILYHKSKKKKEKKKGVSSLEGLKELGMSVARNSCQDNTKIHQISSA